MFVIGIHPAALRAFHTGAPDLKQVVQAPIVCAEALWEVLAESHSSGYRLVADHQRFCEKSHTKERLGYYLLACT